MRSSVIRITALLAAAALSACGGSLSADEFAARADEICRDEQVRFSDAQNELPASPAEQRAQAEALIEIANDTVRRLRELEAPAELDRDYQRYLIAREDGIGLIVQGRDSAEQKDTKAYRFAQQTSIDRAAGRRRLAAALGFEICGPGPGGKG